MPLKIFLTSDIHLGMKFAGYQEEVQHQLIDARFRTLENIVARANKDACDLFVLAGDLFDRISVARRDIHSASEILGKFEGRLTVILPGNHDYISTAKSNLWTYFDEKKGDNVLIIREKAVIPLKRYDLDVNLYPAPCYAKHSDKNSIGWIPDIQKDESVTYHIGIGHGSLEGFSPDFDKKYYPMTSSELLACGLDMWLMGHTHIQYPSRPSGMDKIFYPATPEPDGFDCNHEGKAWIIEIDKDKKITPASVSAGTHRFLHENFKISKESDLERLKQQYDSGDYSKTLLKLKLTGRLCKETYRHLPRIREAMDKHFFYLQWDDSEVTQEITQDDIDREFAQESFPHRLLSELAKKPEDFEALQEAYHLITEAKK